MISEMKESRRTNGLIAISLFMIAAAFSAYAIMALNWFKSAADTSSVMLLNPASRTEADEGLTSARNEFRARLLNIHAHLRLSNALWKAGRSIDSFYVLYAARQMFSHDSFLRAHAEVTLGAGGPAELIRLRLKGLREASLSIPIHAEIARRYPDTPEGRQSLDTLSRLSAGEENSQSAYLARTALEDIHHADPGHPGKLEALGMAFFARGNLPLAHAVASEALSKNPNHAGAAQIMGALALQNKAIDDALRWLTLAWDGNPDNLYTAAKLAQIYDKHHADSESALPFYLALYRMNPDFAVGGDPIERRIREILDVRRKSLLQNAPVESLGARFSLDDASLRAEACERAASFQDPRWIDRLGELLNDDAEIVRRNADFALFEIGKKERAAVHARRDAWLGSGKPLVRIRALNLFADLDGKNAFPALTNALRDADPAVRAFAKVMVLDHYFATLPEAAPIRARYLASENDPEALSLLARFSAQ